MKVNENKHVNAFTTVFRCHFFRSVLSTFYRFGSIRVCACTFILSLRLVLHLRISCLFITFWNVRIFLLNLLAQGCVTCYSLFNCIFLVRTVLPQYDQCFTQPCDIQKGFSPISAKNTVSSICPFSYTVLFNFGDTLQNCFHFYDIYEFCSAGTLKQWNVTMSLTRTMFPHLTKIGFFMVMKIWNMK